MKKTTVILISAIVVCAVVFASLCDYSEISKYDIVSGVAIDLDKDKWTVTCEICVPSSNNDFASSVTYVTGEGYTLDNAFDDAALKSANDLFTDSTQLYLISKTANENNCLLEYLKSDKVNMRAVAVWTDSAAKDVFESEDSENSRAKSLAIANKIKDYCKQNKIRPPRITDILLNSDNVFVSKDKTPERIAEQ